jgi:hypothetical protein
MILKKDECFFVLQAQCLYDFEGDADNGELSFYSGDVLTIIRQVRAVIIHYLRFDSRQGRLYI